MTMSWGTSHLAVELAKPESGTEAAVLGCGGVGLATARLLQRRGVSVTIYAKNLPPETTSNIAGAQWWPTSMFDDDKATPEFRGQFVRAAKLSYREYQDLPGERYGISWVRNYQVSRSGTSSSSAPTVRSASSTPSTPTCPRTPHPSVGTHGASPR